MKVIGITGGVGCGKSAVVSRFAEEYGAYVILADDVAKLLMQKGKPAYEKIVDVFGENILLENGELDRGRLADIVFHNRNKLMVLNSIVHPAVKKYIIEEVTRLRISEEYPYVLVEAALLIEEHYETVCDEFWYIYADSEVRRCRLKESRGYTDDRIDSMLKSQLSETEYRAHCSHVIDNSGSITDTFTQIKKILEE